MPYIQGVEDIRAVPRESQPPPLDSLLGYEFFQIDADTGKPQEFRLEFGPEARQHYLAKLYDLAYEITELLATVKNVGVTDAVETARETVFLAEKHRI